MATHEQLNLWHVSEAPTARLLTVKEPADLLAVSRSTVYELIGSGKLEVLHIGRSARIPLDAVLLTSRRSGACRCRRDVQPYTRSRASPTWPPTRRRGTREQVR